MDKGAILALIGMAVVGGGAYAFMRNQTPVISPVQAGMIPSGPSDLEQALIGASASAALLSKIGPIIGPVINKVTDWWLTPPANVVGDMITPTVQYDAPIGPVFEPMTIDNLSDADFDAALFGDFDW